MSIPELYSGPCAGGDCSQPAEIAGWCPAHALARYREQSVRPTPDRWSKYYTRPQCAHDGCKMCALRGQRCCRYHSD